VSDTNDEERTLFVRPSDMQTPRPAVPAEPEDGDEQDKTVMMKPSQRAREAAVALSEDRKRQSEKDQIGDLPASLGADGAVDFDVTQGTQTASKPPDKGPNYRWLLGFLIGAAIMVVALLALLLFI